MAISKYRAALFLAGLAAVGCGVVNDPAPPSTEPEATEATEVIGEPVGGLRRDALAKTHARVTQLFINQPSFGGGRMFIEYFPDADVVRSSASIAQRPEIAILRASPVRHKDAPPHVSFQKRAAAMANQGWFHFEDAELWEFKTVQLVGLVKHPGPVAYETDEVTMPKGVGEIPTRTLDAFEVRALRKLREGEDLYAEAIPGQRARAMGPIYAGAKCVSCHANAGELLGAFSYTYDIGPAVAKPAGVATPPMPQVGTKE